MDWVSTLEEKPSLIPPTKGSVYPLGQLITQAFSEQTRQGWETNILSRSDQHLLEESSRFC